MATHHKETAPTLLMTFPKEKLPKGAIADRCTRFSGSEGVAELRRLLPQLIRHAAQGDAAPEMQYVLRTRERLAHLAKDLRVHTNALEEKKEKQKAWFAPMIDAALREHPEGNGNGAVHRVIDAFARRFRTCAALAGVCGDILMEQLETDIASYLEKEDGKEEEQESPQQRAIRESEQQAHGVTPSAAIEQNPSPGDSGKPVPPPQATTGTPTDGPIPLEGE